MKTKDKELTIFTPGLSSQSLTMDYHEIDNCVLAGLVGSGKDTALSAIVKSMIESNKIGKFSYLFIDACERTNPLANCNRITSYNELQAWLTNDKFYFEFLANLLESLLLVVNTKFACPELKTCVDGVLVVIVNNFGGLPEYIQLLVRYLMLRSKNSTKIKVIVAGQPSEITYDMVNNSRYRITTRVPEDTSNLLLDCNIGCRHADKYGSVWFYDVEEPRTWTNHIVNFVPDSLMNRMLKTYAGGKPSNNRVVHECHLASNHINRESLFGVIDSLFHVDSKSSYEAFLEILRKEYEKND